MTIEHHPEETALTSYAAGLLDLGQRVAIATHLRGCRRCREWVGAMEQVGGKMVEDCEPADMAVGALEKALARLDEPAEPAHARPVETGDAPKELPDFVRGYAFGAWRFIGPRVRMRPIHLPEPGPTRVFLLKAAPNTKLLRHEHTVREMTCVLKGAFRHRAVRYGPGDFDFGDDTIAHEPWVEAGEECVCLVAMQGELRWKGPWGLLARTFVRL